ncbi:hypothetical protein AVEN_235566-1 [Araneus ventricosus]|uniref:Uncharacterized protein n=1 Tax=Araneus ventricosus TaxID=182803 RepID=A0A4Y2BQG3_ARAVE|nr:hypothetical protein AVEN_235566-1 [Araneus ventricosus]
MRSRNKGVDAENKKRSQYEEYFGFGRYSFVCNHREEGLNDGDARERGWRAAGKIKGGPQKWGKGYEFVFGVFKSKTSFRLCANGISGVGAAAEF